MLRRAAVANHFFDAPATRIHCLMNYPELVRALFNTLVICLGCIAIALPVGMLLAIAIRRTDIWGRRVLWLALCSQLAIPLYVVAGSWNAGFGTQGWWPLAQTFAVQHRSAAMLAVIFIHAAASIPWVCMLLSCGLVGSQRNVEELALTEGGRRHWIGHALVPALNGWGALSCAWICLPILTEMVVTNLYQVPTVAEQVYLDASRGRTSGLTYPVAVLLCIVPVVVAFLTANRSAPPWREVISRSRQHQTLRLKLAGLRSLVSLGTASVVLVLVGVPIMNLVIKAGWQPFSDTAGTIQYRWAWKRFSQTLWESLTLFTGEFYWSFVLAFVAASMALFSAIFLTIVGRNKIVQFAIHGAMLVMIGTPGAMVAGIVIFLLNRSEPALLGFLYDQTIAAPVLAQQFRLLPAAWFAVWVILASINPASLQLAKLEQLNWWQMIRAVIWPQTYRYWFISWYLLALMSVGELSTTILLLPPGVTTVSMRLFEMLHFGMRHQDSGVCLVLVLVGWISSLVVWNTLSDRKRSPEPE